MIGICNLIIDYSRISTDSILEQVVAIFSEAKAPYFAERAIWIFYELFKERLLFKEAASLLVKLAGEVCLKIY